MFSVFKRGLGSSVVLFSVLIFASHASASPDLNKNKRAALLGNADAQTSLGVRYEKGDGVTQDMAQSVAWYRKVAEQGNA